MKKIGFKPKWLPIHDERAEQFEKTYLVKGKKITAVVQHEFMEWLYDKKS